MSYKFEFPKYLNTGNSLFKSVLSMENETKLLGASGSRTSTARFDFR